MRSCSTVSSRKMNDAFGAGERGADCGAASAKIFAALDKTGFAMYTKQVRTAGELAVP